MQGDQQQRTSWTRRQFLQTAGRAARNRNGEVILYADKITNSMWKAIDETNRRRAKQLAYNKEHNINPETIYKTREEILRSTSFADSKTIEEKTFEKPSHFARMSREDQLAFMMKAMKKAAENLEFETAALIRDEIQRMRREMKTGRRGKK